MENDDRKRLLFNLCYVDKNLKITQDVSQAVGFLDLIADKSLVPRYIINFFTPIGTARHWKEAMDMIKQWLDEKYKDHDLVKYLFEPALPMTRSVALCNENEFVHGKFMADNWVYLLFGDRYEYAPYGSDELSYILSTNAYCARGKLRYEEKDGRQEGLILDITKIVWNDDAGTVFPAVIVDEFRFLYLNSCVDRNDLCKEYSFTYKVFDYNDYKEYEFRRKNYGKPAFSIITERGGFLVED